MGVEFPPNAAAIIEQILADERRAKYVNKQTADEYEEYYESGRWKCDESPTGAHRWNPLYRGAEAWQCVYCESYRLYPLTFYDALKHRHNPMYKRVYSKEQVMLVVEVMKEGGEL